VSGAIQLEAKHLLVTRTKSAFHWTAHCL
jgi:hypothetical protein